jgi:hypothetical protein
MQFLATLLALLVILAALLWVLVPAFYGLPPVSTRPGRIRKALNMAGLRPGETLYDLGSGHGRVLVIAAGEFSARAVGIEAGPVQRTVCRVNALWNRVSPKVQIEGGDFFQADLSRADVIYAYLTSKYAGRLEEKLQRELKPGARVVTVAFDLPGWTPADFDRENLLYLYRK